MQKDILDFYATPTETTRLGKHVHLAAWLTDDVRALFQVVQGLIVHDRWLERYGTAETAAQHYPGHIAFAEDLLDRAFVLDPRSPAVPRPPEKRVIACCREYALLLCALLRAKGIPARARCGFATYFAVPGRYEDHWACEYWCDRTKRWIMVDPQIDPYQQSFLRADFDPLDVPDTHFIPGGKAWSMCRDGRRDPDSFGISADPARFGLDSLYGMWFVRGNLLRDVAALNKSEPVPFLVRLEKHLTWHPWRLVHCTDEELSRNDIDLLDRVAAFSADPDRFFDSLRYDYAIHADLRPPREVLVR